MSSKTYEGMENLRDFLTKKQVSLPEKKVQFYKLMLKEKKNYFKVTELHQPFKILYFKIRQIFQEDQIMKQFTLALEYYRDAGHVLHFPDNPLLEDYVFHTQISFYKSCNLCSITISRMPLTLVTFAKVLSFLLI